MKKYKFQKYFMFDGKRYVVRADSEFELATKYANKIRDLEEGKVTSGGNIKVKDWAYKAIEIYKTRQSDITRDKYVSRVNSCILQHIGNFPLKSIKPINCQELLNLQSGKSQRHINEVYQALNFIFSKAVENQLIINNPAKNIIKPIGSKKHYRAITDQEEIHIKEIAKTDRKYYLYLLMLFCGCRPSEAAEVQGKDIITENKYPLLHIRGTKTHNADRVVPLPLELYEIIKDTKHNEYVACYSNGNKIKYENRYRVWQSIKRQINIRMGCKMYRNKLIPPFPVADDLVPYCLRHTYCTNLARYGVDIRMAQKLMGHADITPTANIYTNLDDNDVIDVAKKLNENYPGVA